MKYEKIVKWVLAALFAVGVVFSFYGFVVGFETNGNAPVDNMLYCAYAFALTTILAVVFGVVVIGGINNPKSLLKLLLGLVAGGAIIAVAYVLAPGTPAIGYLGNPVSDGTLKLVDTVLNLTYFFFGGALLTLVAGWIIGAIRK
jgi:ABC-type antimicrobial peptide transport system permease subunit